MFKKIDRYIVLRLAVISFFVLAVLIFIFIVIDFSENSDDFTDQGATMAEILGQYYLNYIPEMTRLVIPMAVFVACIYLTGQMTERLEIVALKAAGVSLYRLIMPYLFFGFVCAGLISYLDGFVIPDANAERIKFERKYISKKNRQVDRNKIYRQESANSIFKFNFFNLSDTVAYNVDIVEFGEDSIKSTASVDRMIWNGQKQLWHLVRFRKKVFEPGGFREINADTVDTVINILPRDLARTTSDIYQLTYPEAQNYIASIERSGAGRVNLPKVQFFGRLVYPFSIIVVTIVGFSLAAERRRGGKGFYIAAGLTISFLYLAFLKIAEPFGASGELTPVSAALLPHLFFLVVGVGILLFTKK
ncbi:MAG: LptF/LptG family permease [Balneolaceae bacterium]|nr:LptF/LptG family permease [Balneolaceae bacterium]